MGIISFGAYIPRYFVNRKQIFGAVGFVNPAVFFPGTKAVANYDEDSISMAVEASRNCIGGLSKGNIDSVYFATTTAPYVERQNSAVISGALGLSDAVRSADFTNSQKAGTSALISALEAAEQGKGEAVVCAADTRIGKVGSFQEYLFGDAAAAVLVGNENEIAKFKGHFSLSVDFMGSYKANCDEFDHRWEERWVRDVGYRRLIPQAIAGFLKKYGRSLDEFNKVVYSCPFDREHAIIGKTLQLDPAKIQPNLSADIGDCGAAYPLLMLCAALEDAKPGDNILLAGFGNGCDVLAFEVTDKILSAKKGRGIKSYLQQREELTYDKYLVFKELVAIDVGIRGEEIPFTQISTAFRERKTVLGLIGSKCKACGTPHLPSQLICVNPECGAIKQMEDYTFTDKKATLFSYTADMLAPTVNPPALYGMVDFDGGGRFTFDITDCHVKELKGGIPVTLSFRRKYVDKKRGIYGYFWKAVPQREEK